MTAPLSDFEACLGPDRVDVSDNARELAAHDIAGASPEPVLAVLRPKDADAVAAAVAVARKYGLAVYPRGGGMSYTSSYLPDRGPALCFDLADLDCVMEIDVASRSVKVEAGCTWASLFDALTAKGFRTPFFGPLSGIAATVGGSLSQNGAYFGSAAFGYAGDHVLGLEVADGTGRLHKLGAWGAGRLPGLPHFGPDLLGPFLGDCGAFGIKTKAVLPIRPLPPAPAFASFRFDTVDAVLSAMQAFADIPHLAEVWAMDRVAHQNLAASGFSVLEAGEIAAGIAGGSQTLGDAARNLVSAARVRRAVLADLPWSLHVVIEPPLTDLALPMQETVISAACKARGRAVLDTIPRVTRARPFRTIKALIGPDGERWLPCHAVFPVGLAGRGIEAVVTAQKKFSDGIARHDLRTTVLLAAVGGEILVEPQLLWSDALTPFQVAHSPKAQAALHLAAAPDPDARRLAHGVRDAMSEAMADAGGTHLQIGRHYRYFEDLPTGMRDLLRAVKSAMDPDNILNPGVLGLPKRQA